MDKSTRILWLSLMTREISQLKVLIKLIKTKKFSQIRTLWWEMLVSLLRTSKNVKDISLDALMVSKPRMQISPEWLTTASRNSLRTTCNYLNKWFIKISETPCLRIIWPSFKWLRFLSQRRSTIYSSSHSINTFKPKIKNSNQNKTICRASRKPKRARSEYYWQIAKRWSSIRIYNLDGLCMTTT